MKRGLSLALCAVFVLPLLVSCARSKRPLTAAELLDLGEKYLLEMNYDQAVICFNRLIEIEPMGARGYMGLADAYLGLGDDVNAEAALQRGLAALPGSAEIQARLDARAALMPREAVPASAPDVDFITIQGVRYSTALTSLDLSARGLTDADIEPLRHMTNLTGLELYVNSICDVSALKGLTNLTVLDLRSNQIRDVGALEGLTDLTVLYLSGNQVGDIGALEGLTNLTELSLSDNRIGDIGALKGMRKLTALYLSDNQIGDISVLEGLMNLTELSLYYNPVSAAQKGKIKDALPECILYD